MTRGLEAIEVVDGINIFVVADRRRRAEVCEGFLELESCLDIQPVAVVRKEVRASGRKMVGGAMVIKTA